MMKNHATTRRAPPLAVTSEERYRMINDAVYFRLLKRRQETGCECDEAQCWCEVEAEIDGVLKNHHAG